MLIKKGCYLTYNSICKFLENTADQKNVVTGLLSAYCVRGLLVCFI